MFKWRCESKKWRRGCDGLLVDLTAKVRRREGAERERMGESDEKIEKNRTDRAVDGCSGLKNEIKKKGWRRATGGCR